MLSESNVPTNAQPLIHWLVLETPCLTLLIAYAVRRTFPLPLARKSHFSAFHLSPRGHRIESDP